MSDKISYILEVLDGYSVTTKKLKTDLTSLNLLFKKLDSQIAKTSLSFQKISATSHFSKLTSQTDSLVRSTDRLNQVNRESLNIAKQHQRIPLTNNRVAVGNYAPTRFNPTAGKFESSLSSKGLAAGVGAGMAGAGMMSNVKPFLASMGILTGVYAVGKSVKYVHDTTVQMDSLRASLHALIPKVKGLENATPEGEIKYLRGVGDKYGLNFSDIAPSYVKMLGTGGKIDASLARGLVESIGGYGGLLGLSSPAMSDTMRGFQDMLTKQVLNAQEVNLQMQQLPGIKPLLHKAFRKVATKAGITGITPENESQMFMKAMSYGTLKSAPILRQLVEELFAEFGKDMLEKAYKLRNEKNRLASATQELATSLGDMTYNMQIGTVRGMTDALKSFNEQINIIVGSFKLIDNVFGDSKVFKILGGMVGGLGTVLTSGTAKLVEAPFKAAHDLGGLIAAGATGDKEAGLEIMKNWANYYFGTGSNTAPIQNQSNMPPQEVVVRIVAENIPDMFTIKQEQNMSVWQRPSTIIAGGR